jgi:poly(3-hydroxybutyrate) depolymerase
LLGACSSGEGSADGPQGGSSSAGQSNAGTGTTNTGGHDSSGGTTSNGGNLALGGNKPVGGSGGATSNGGASNAGSSSGGGGGSGGTSSGGADSSGGTGGASPMTPSPGCKMAAGQALGSWVEQPKLNVGGTDRQWWLWLPTGYDPNKAYPVVFNFHGCGSSDNIVPMQKVTADKAILVRATGISAGTCWDANATGNDVKLFDQMLADVVAKRCVDTSRVFATGYSSGSWLVNTLECERGDKLRATGTVSGGTYGDKSKCKGKYARMFIHDQDDTTNTIAQGNDKERDRLIAANHCMATGPVMEAPAPCARYQGCDAGFPVIWCQTQGKMHDRQDNLAPGAFWGLFSGL